MNCPYCQTALAEHSTECHACQLDFPRVVELLGPARVPHDRLDDASGCFSPLQRWRLLRKLDAIEHRFPQVRVQVRCHPLPTEHPAALYLFWLFNSGGLGPETPPRSHRHAILIALDPGACRAGIMLGYALEPFISQEELDRCLDIAAKALARRHWSGGLRKILSHLDRVLASALRHTLDAFELGPAGPPADTAAAAPAFDLPATPGPNVPPTG